MKIGLDYDDTFTLDPIFWGMVVAFARANLHEVRFVTYRIEPEEGVGTYNDDIKADAEALGIEVVFTNGRQKSNCWDADVWIDDMPETIPKAHRLYGMYQGCIQNEDMS